MPASKSWKGLGRAPVSRGTLRPLQNRREGNSEFLRRLLSEGAVTNALEWQHLHGVAAEVLNAFGRPLEALR